MKIQIIFIVLLYVTNTCAQQAVLPSCITYKKTEYPSITISFKADDKEVSGAIRAIVKEGKGSVKNKKRVIIGKKWQQAGISSRKLNNWWLVKSTGKRSKEIVTVHMSLQIADSLFITDPDDSTGYARAVAYLSTLPLRVEMYRKDMALASLKKQLFSVTVALADMRRRSDRKQRDYDKKAKDVQRLTEKIESLERASIQMQ